MVRTAPTATNPALLDTGEWGENDEATSLHTVRALLELYLEMSLLAPEAQAAALAAMRSEDERQLFKFALSYPGTDDFVELVDRIESRATEAAPEPPVLSADEFAQFYAAFDAVPAQLHHAMLARLGGVREAFALALLSLPLTDAAAAAPHLLPLLLAPGSGGEAAEAAVSNAEAAVSNAEAVGAAIVAFDALSLAARAALIVEVSEREPVLGALLHLLAAGPASLSAESLPPVLACLMAMVAGRKPPADSCAPLHAALCMLSAQELPKVVRLAAEAGPLLEAAPYMEEAQWSALLHASCEHERLVVDARRVARALLRSEVTHLRTWIVHNPEERALLGFFAGWFMLLCSTFGILDMLVTIQPLQLMLNLYIALLAGLACALEIKSTWLRDHLTLGLERHCALLRFATGRGCVYFATGFLAFDVHDGPMALGGGMLLAVGLFNVALGTWVAPKLKKLRRAAPSEAALLTAFRAVTGRRPEGLDAAEFGRFCDTRGVHFNRLEMQAIFLELDAHRDGLISQSELLTWYHGHVQPQLKRLANATPAQPRRLSRWLLGGRDVLLELPLYAALTARILLPFAAAGMLSAALGSRVPVAAVHAQTDEEGKPVMVLSCNIASLDGSYEALSAEDQCLTTPSGFDCCVTERSFVQLVINLHLMLASMLMWLLETRSEAYRRTALHVLRYASLLLHHTARGALYLLLALALFAQGSSAPWLANLGYLVEVLGIAHVLVGLRTSRALGLLRKRLPTPRAARGAFDAVAHGGASISRFQLKQLCQTYAVPLRFAVEEVALLNAMDLQRTGRVSEAEFLFWLTEGSDAEALQPGAIASGPDGAEWLGSSPARGVRAPVAPMERADEALPPTPPPEEAGEAGEAREAEGKQGKEEGSSSWQDV